MRRKFVCLAKSVKYNDLCVAGKEVLPDGTIGNWIRPIHPINNSIPMNDFNFNIGDIVSADVTHNQQHPTQPENYILDSMADWRKEGEISVSDFNLLVDNPTSIWCDNEVSSSIHGVNDRVTESCAKLQNSSLLFVFLPKAVVVKNDQSTESGSSIKLRLNFIFKSWRYSLVITDPKLSGLFWHDLQVGEQSVINNCFVTISLGESFYGYCYKLIAGYINV